MNERLSQWRQQTVAFWQGLPPGRRWLLAGAALATLIFLLAAGFWFGRTDYAPLFTNLSTEDAGQVVAKLKDENIPYRLEGNGSTILVPKDKVYETRLALAAEGMPKGGVVGFELFQQSQLGSTEFDRRLKYIWALQGELTRTIREMREVEDVRVHIVQPQPSLFINEESPSTASVLLKLKPYAKLSEEQIRAIANLVAGSVEGLKPENVTILDTNGNLLSDILRAEPDRAQGKQVLSQLEVKQAYEKELAKNIQTMLERAFGPGKVVARVNVDMNFDTREATTDIYSPATAGGNKGIIRSEERHRESFQGTGSPPGGVAGVTANVPGYTALNQGQAQYDKEDITTNYEINKRQERQVESPGKIQRISAAVWVDGRLSPQEISNVEKSVAAVIGYSQARGDMITVQSMAFDRSWSSAFATPPQRSPWSTLAYLLLSLIPLGILGAWFLSRRRKAEEADLQPLLAGAAEEAAATQPAEGEDKLLTERERAANLEALERLVRQKPEEVAKLIETWLHEEGTT